MPTVPEDAATLVRNAPLPHVADWQLSRHYVATENTVGHIFVLLQVAALCIFADAVNFGGEQAARAYSNVFLPAALLSVCPPTESADEDQLLAVAAAAYGLGKWL